MRGLFKGLRTGVDVFFDIQHILIIWITRGKELCLTSTQIQVQCSGWPRIGRCIKSRRTYKGESRALGERAAFSLPHCAMERRAGKSSCGGLGRRQTHPESPERPAAVVRYAASRTLCGKRYRKIPDAPAFSHNVDAESSRRRGRRRLFLAADEGQLEGRKWTSPKAD